MSKVLKNYQHVPKRVKNSEWFKNFSGGKTSCIFSHYNCSVKQLKTDMLVKLYLINFVQDSSKYKSTILINFSFFDHASLQQCFFNLLFVFRGKKLLLIVA